MIIRDTKQLVTKAKQLYVLKESGLTWDEIEKMSIDDIEKISLDILMKGGTKNE